MLLPYLLLLLKRSQLGPWVSKTHLSRKRDLEELVSPNNKISLSLSHSHLLRLDSPTLRPGP